MLSLDQLLNIVRRDGLIDRYETGATRVTFYQGDAVFSLGLDAARDFLQRVVRASGISLKALETDPA